MVPAFTILFMYKLHAEAVVLATAAVVQAPDAETAGALTGFKLNLLPLWRVRVPLTFKLRPALALKFKAPLPCMVRLPT